jgi:hypothetical protein
MIGEDDRDAYQDTKALSRDRLYFPVVKALRSCWYFKELLKSRIAKGCIINNIATEIRLVITNIFPKYFEKINFQYCNPLCVQ